MKLAYYTVLGVAWLALASTPAQTPAAPAAPPVAPPPGPTAMTLPPNEQAAIDAAWKDLRIAQLQLQLTVTQISDAHGYVYDFQQQKFFVRPPGAEPAKPEPLKPEPLKPVPPPKSKK